MCFGSSARKNLPIYCLGLVCRVKTLLYIDQPQEGKKYIYIFADWPSNWYNLVNIFLLRGIYRS